MTHDIGNMVGYGLAAQYPDRISKWVVIDAPLPGIGPWDKILKSPLLWHFNFRGPDVDRLVRGASASISTGSTTSCRQTRRQLMRARAIIMRSFTRDRATCMTLSSNSRHLPRTPRTIKYSPRKSWSCRSWHSRQKSFGDQQAAILREVGTNVEGGIITGSGHWIMEEQPDQAVKLIAPFVDAQPAEENH